MGFRFRVYGKDGLPGPPRYVEQRPYGDYVGVYRDV